MRARYYNVDIKRFINQDILTGTIDSIQSLNRYAYVEGNPVSFLDPFGLCPSDNDDLPKFYQTAGYIATGIAIVALVVAVIASGGVAGVAAGAVGSGVGAVTTTTAVTATAGTVGAVASGVGTGSTLVDGYLYAEDLKNADDADAAVKAIDGMTDSALYLFLNSMGEAVGRTFSTMIDGRKVQIAVEGVASHWGDYTAVGNEIFENE